MCNCNKAKRVAPAAVLPAATAVRPAPRTALVSLPSLASLPLSSSSGQAPLILPGSTITVEAVDTSIWGAHLWRVLHIASVFTKSRALIQPWRKLLEALKTDIPCPDCAAHYSAWYAKHGIRFSIIGNGIQGPLVRWLLDLHNDVNGRLEEPAPAWSVKQVLDAYGGDRDVQIAVAQEELRIIQDILGPTAVTALRSLLAAL
jgi:hypothetical protein